MKFDILNYCCSNVGVKCFNDLAHPSFVTDHAYIILSSTATVLTDILRQYFGDSIKFSHKLFSAYQIH